MATDPIVLAAQAREILAGLHKRGDTVVRFKTNRSGYTEDAVDKLDERAPGHFRADKKVLTLNLDTLLNGKPIPDSLGTIEDWRKYPILAGVAAHESAHARFSLWDSEGNEVPESIPNPDYDPADPDSPAEFPVSETGKLLDIAKLLEEPRVERLGVKTFTKTWRRAMQFSATHLILERVDEDDANGKDPLDAALNLVILIGGRLTAGTLGVSYDSRRGVKKVLESAQKIIETALQERMADDPDFDPYHEVMKIVADSVFDNNHTDATPRLEAARQILKIIHPERADDPDGGDGDGEGEEGDGGGSTGAGGSSSGEGEGEDGEGEGEGEDDEGEGSGSSERDAAMQALMEGMAESMKEAMDGLITEMRKEIVSEESQPEGEGGGGYGATIYRDPRAPGIDHHEQPNADDRELYRRAVDWMERQIQPTVTEFELGQWLPVGGARLDVRSYVRDNLANHRANQRTDWNRVSETVKPAPPVKVAVMLDGSGSMSSKRRLSASIGWAAANAAAQLPESRTVSVVYGAAAAVTQKPGHDPVRTVAVSRTDGPWENFGHAVELVEEALWLDEPLEEGEKSNVLIVIVSDLMYGGSAPFRGEYHAQGEVFTEVTAEWADKGYQTVVVGADPARFPSDGSPNQWGVSTKHVRLVKPDELFR